MLTNSEEAELRRELLELRAERERIKHLMRTIYWYDDTQPVTDPQLGCQYYRALFSATRFYALEALTILGGFKPC